MRVAAEECVPPATGHAGRRTSLNATQGAGAPSLDDSYGLSPPHRFAPSRVGSKFKSVTGMGPDGLIETKWVHGGP